MASAHIDVLREFSSLLVFAETRGVSTDISEAEFAM